MIFKAGTYIVDRRDIRHHRPVCCILLAEDYDNQKDTYITYINYFWIEFKSRTKNVVISARASYNDNEGGTLWDGGGYHIANKQIVSLCEKELQRVAKESELQVATEDIEVFLVGKLPVEDFSRDLENKPFVEINAKEGQTLRSYPLSKYRLIYGGGVTPYGDTFGPYLYVQHRQYGQEDKAYCTGYDMDEIKSVSRGIIPKGTKYRFDEYDEGHSEMLRFYKFETVEEFIASQQ